jgi:hypothetical protein
MPSCARKHQLQGSLLYHAFSRSSGRNNIFLEPGDFYNSGAIPGTQYLILIDKNRVQRQKIAIEYCVPRIIKWSFSS